MQGPWEMLGEPCQEDAIDRADSGTEALTRPYGIDFATLNGVRSTS